jgi:hypothetical protein
METKPTEQTFEISTPGQTGKSVVRILSETSEQLTKAYERLKWLGFTSIAGALVILVTFGLSVTPGFNIPFESQLLFTATGFCTVLIGASVFAMQNIHAYGLETKNREFALRSLELQHEEKKAVIEQPAIRPPESGYTPPRG